MSNKRSPSPSFCSTGGKNFNLQRASSDDDISQIISAPLARELSSGFNYQTLAETSNLNSNIPPVRSHSSTNAELNYHLQQLRNLSKRKTTFSGEEKNDE